jgi:hypothetical protein
MHDGCHHLDHIFLYTHERKRLKILFFKLNTNVHAQFKVKMDGKECRKIIT